MLIRHDDPNIALDHHPHTAEVAAKLGELHAKVFPLILRMRNIVEDGAMTHRDVTVLRDCIGNALATYQQFTAWQEKNTARGLAAIVAMNGQ